MLGVRGGLLRLILRGGLLQDWGELRELLEHGKNTQQETEQEQDRRERLSRHRSGNIAVMMVGNKSDLNHLRSVPEEDRQPGIFVRRRKACPSSRHLPLEGGNKRREGVPHHTILSEIHQTLSKKALAAQQSASANGRSMHGTNHH